MSFAHPFPGPALARQRGLLRSRRRLHAVASLLLAGALPAFLVPSIGPSWGATLVLLAAGVHLAIRALPDWYRCPACGEPAAEDGPGSACSRCASRAG